MPLLFWVILCVVGYFLSDLIPIGDLVFNRVVKALSIIGLIVCLVISTR